MEVKHIYYKNRKILYIDYRGATMEQELLDVLHQGIKMHDAEPELDILANFENVPFTNKFTEEAKELTKDRPSKTALVGITGLAKVFVTAVIVCAHHKNTKLFNSETEAKEWLVIEKKMEG